MAADTTIGGPGRLDFRSTDPAGGADATLNTGGHAYNLTKVSVNTLQMASVQIDSALANINVQQGTLSFQGNMPSLGNPGSAITVSGGATLQFNVVVPTMNKALILNDGAIVSSINAGADTFGGPVTLLGNGLFNIATAGPVTFSNSISGTGSLSKVTGAGTLTLTASNTYTGSTVVSAGTLALTEPGDIRTSLSIALGAGTTLDVSGRTDQTLTVLGGHSLTGSGTVNGSLVDAATSTVAPGTPVSIGTLTVSGNATLNGTNVIKLVETNLTSDVLAVGAALQLGGTLQVVNLAGSLHSGDSFQIFTAGGGFSGNFTSISPAIPGFNLAWDTNALATTGFLTVSGPGANTSPTNIVATFNGANLTLTWPMDHTGWRLQVQTNNLATGLGANWVDVPNSTSTNQIVVPANPANGAVFYRMVYP
jgi:autotransporter-associated beta strand protein